jgi:tetratricopeptide (TPR) repeat protein
MDMREIWDFSDPDGSRSKFLTAIQIADRAEELEIRAQVARTYSLQNEFELAHRFLDRIEAEIDLKSYERAYGCYLLERGRTYNSAGEKDKARECFELALRNSDEEIQVDALHMFGYMSAPSEAIELNRKALTIALASENPWARRWAGTLYNNTGWALFDLGRFDESLVELRSALAERETYQIRVDEAKWCVARCLRALGRFDEALQMLDSMTTNDSHAMEERKLNNFKRKD